MRRLVTVTVAALLVVTSCGGGQDTTSSSPSLVTAPSTSDAPGSSMTSTSSTATLPPTTTRSTTSTTVTTSTSTTTSITVAPTTSTSAPPGAFPPDPYRELPAVVTAAEGVYEVAIDGSTRKLLDGSVAFAIDDTRGGLLYQVDRGRDWEETGERDTTIWWLPAGATVARDLLVPTRSEGHELSLHDVYYDDGIHVVYVRHEGRRSDPGWPGTTRDRFRSYDLSRRSAVDLGAVPAFEAGIGLIQCGGGLIAYSSYNQIGSNCDFIDHSGAPVTIPADIETEPCEIDCHRQCAIGWDGDLLMYNVDYLADPQTRAGTTVVLVNAETAVEIERVVHLSDLSLEFVDLLGNRVLLSWRDGPAVIYDMSNLEQGGTTLPITGAARFAKAPLNLPTASASS